MPYRVDRPDSGPPTPLVPVGVHPDAPAPTSPERRVVVGDSDGRVMVARILGERGREVVAVLPDGRLGWPSGIVPTDRPFRAATMAEVRQALSDGDYRGFQVRQTEHYLVYSRGTTGFTAASAQLLESLYRGLTASLRRAGFPIHEAEFPLVAVIYPTEREFRAHHEVDPDVQALYQVVTNRIIFYETSDRDQDAPEVAALRKPQTVAHEGTHQILLNIGVQPRLAAWPAWLVEGLAEYCAPTTTDRRGDWARFGKVNPFHMATFRDLADPLSLQLRDAGRTTPDLVRDRRRSMIETLTTRADLSPTDYARAWALTHYLVTRQPDRFLAYLRTMGRMLPLEQRQPDEHLALFRASFGHDLDKLDRKVDQYLESLHGFESLPYYAVLYAQPMPDGLTLRRTLVSQSPSVIRQWLEALYSPQGGPPVWEIAPCPTRAIAIYRIRTWLNSQ